MKTVMSRDAARFFCRSALAARASIAPRTGGAEVHRLVLRRGFARTAGLKVVKPYILADIGEGEWSVRV